MQSTKHVSITLADGSTETVQVKELGLKDMKNYLSIIDDEEKIIALCTGKPDNWVQALPLDSAVKIAEADLEVNGEFFQGWMVRRILRLERMHPGIIERLQQPKTQK
ncbi:MAG TPA: hypothetical protein VGO67_23510 [Verrucomicrobiae bacterium]|jgi:hypothetical protein